MCVITSDGRFITGKLLGYDQLQNLIVNNANERVYHLPVSATEDITSTVLEIVPLGLYVIRGDNVAIISDAREEILKEQDTDAFEFSGNCEPLKPIVQFIN